MARISRYPFVSHLRSEASTHVIRYRNGRAVRSGRGLAFWFRPLDTAIAELPLDDQELSFLFRGRSADLQEAVAQGIITYRVHDPDTLAARIDFGIDLASGLYTKTPLDQIAARLTGLAQQHAWAVMASTPLRELVADGVGRLRERIGESLAADQGLGAMGLAIASVRVSAVQPSSEVEKALAAPTRERIAADADEAAFARRAAAVDKERAIVRLRGSRCRPRPAARQASRPPVALTPSLAASLGEAVGSSFVIGRPHHPRRALARVVLDQMMADLMHQAVEEHELGERAGGPVDTGHRWADLDARARALQPTPRRPRQPASQLPRRLALLVKDDDARNLQPGEREGARVLLGRLAKRDRTKSVDTSGPKNVRASATSRRPIGWTNPGRARLMVIRTGVRSASGASG